MRKNLQYKILAAVMTLSAVNWAVPTNVLAENYTVKQDGEIISGNFTTVYGNGHSFTINGGDIDTVYGDTSDGNSADSNAVYISGGSVGYVYGGESESGEAHHNTVNISGDAKVTGTVYGGSLNDGEAYDNTVIISGGSVSGDVYGGYIDDSGSAYDNEIIISGSADITNANLYGRNDKASGTGNTLTIDGWSGFTKSVKNFNDINFDNINWQNGGTVLTITEGADNDLANTEINLNSIAGGSKIAVGDTMTLIESNKNVNLGIKKDNIKVKDNFFAGVAAQGTGTATVKDDGSVEFKVNTFKLNDQIDIVAENRAVAAAFVNQGTDLISDSLDTISRDSNYGVKTFAAVHGNRSKYDVNSDIKINGWSVIAGVGNADKFDNGSEFSWGAFYENGSGNYRPITSLTTSSSAVTAALFITAAALRQGTKIKTAFIPKAASAQVC
jgi:hypothetical protein